MTPQIKTARATSHRAFRSSELGAVHNCRSSSAVPVASVTARRLEAGTGQFALVRSRPRPCLLKLRVHCAASSAFKSGPTVGSVAQFVEALPRDAPGDVRDTSTRWGARIPIVRIKRIGNCRPRAHHDSPMLHPQNLQWSRQLGLATWTGTLNEAIREIRAVIRVIRSLFLRRAVGATNPASPHHHGGFNPLDRWRGTTKLRKR